MVPAVCHLQSQSDNDDLDRESKDVNLKTYMH